MGAAQDWIEAARPRTLPAAVTPVLVGTAAAEVFVAWRFAAALVVGLAVQVGVNYANDYFDGVRGVDTSDRVGPRRLVAAGVIAPAGMRRAMVVAFAVAAAGGVALAAATTWWLVAVGAACFLAALGYSGGPRPYASAGLGEVFVFVFFGLVATIGSQFVHDVHIGAVAVVAALPVGMLAVAILLANNIRDIPTDDAAGKATLAVRLGLRGSQRLFTALLTGAFAAVPLVAVVAESGWPLVALAAIPLAIAPARRVFAGADLVAALEGTARLHLAFGLLLAGGLVVA